jgi:glycosyltransferase involved in cell wall biosynthesis
MNVSCIIPAFNEASRIGRVLSVAQVCPLINEIIVVDDGSTDNTADVVRKHSDITFIEHPQNKGKSASVYDGIKRATGDYILLLDADLLNLTPDDLDRLVRPVTEGRTDVTISLRGNTPVLWKWIGIDYISGERCFHRSLCEDALESIKNLRGFSLEVFLNQLIITKRLRVTVIPWMHVESPLKRRVFGISFDFVVIGWHVLREISLGGAYTQIIKLKRLMAP